VLGQVGEVRRVEQLELVAEDRPDVFVGLELERNSPRVHGARVVPEPRKEVALVPPKARDREETLGSSTVAPGEREGLVDESQHSRNVAVLARLEEIDAGADAKQPSIDRVPLVEPLLER
jgi:hypothetical protein